MEPEPPAGRRPNTQAPVTKLAVDSADIENLSDERLIAFADTLGIVIPPDTKRSVILQKIVNAATGSRTA